MLSLRDISYTYPQKDADLFNGLSHDFPEGKITALTGPSGRGKSTLLYLAGLLLSPTRGSVLLGGQPVSAWPDDRKSAARANCFGFVFQDAALDASRPILDSILEPALYAGRSRRPLVERASALLSRMGVDSRSDHKPGEISGGQAQRVAICRALLIDPPVILADEPTGNLDSANTVTILSLLRDEADAGKTVVVATHDDAVMAHADDRLLLT